VTFVAVKKGFTLSRTVAKYTGEIFVASIGVEPDAQTYPRECVKITY